MMNVSSINGVNNSRLYRQNDQITLAKDQAFAKFLPKAIEFLRNKPFQGLEIANFLMGQPHKWPQELGAKPTIQPTSNKILAELLFKPQPTHIFLSGGQGWFQAHGESTANNNSQSQGLTTWVASKQDLDVLCNLENVQKEIESVQDDLKLDLAIADMVRNQGLPPGLVEDGQGGYRMPNGTHYTGEVVNNQAHGSGIASKNNKVIYNGNWNNGQKEGLGSGEYKDGWYTGNWQAGKPHGHGSIKSNTASNQVSFYNGDWESGKRSGPGRGSYLGGVYTGVWKNDKPHGEGTITFPNGVTYSGRWSFGKVKGNAQGTCPEGTYTGGWQGDKPHGKGCMNYADGTKYNGLWQNGVKSGHGLGNYNGGEFLGQWQNDLPNGNGSLLMPNGLCFIGTFVNGKLEGHGTFTSQGRTIYSGQWQNNVQRGVGTIYHANGDQYTGAVLYGYAHGIGTYRYANGDSLTGQFDKDSLVNGTINYQFANGVTYTGQWANNQSLQLETQILDDLITGQLPTSASSYFSNVNRNILAPQLLNIYRAFYQTLLAHQCTIAQTGLPANANGTYDLNISNSTNLPANTPVVILNQGPNNVLILSLEYFLNYMRSNLLSQMNGNPVSDPRNNPYTNLLITTADFATANAVVARQLPANSYQT